MIKISTSSASLVVLFFVCHVITSGFSQAPTLILPVGHAGPVAFGTFSPDGEFIATVSQDDLTVKVWDADNGKLLRNFVGHTDEVFKVGFFPDGSRIFTVAHGSDNTVRVWDLASGALVASTPAHSSVYEAFLLPGNRLAVVDVNRIAIYDASTGKRVASIDDKRISTPTHVGISAQNDKLILVNSMLMQPEVTIWDLNKGNFAESVKANQSRQANSEFDRLLSELNPAYGFVNNIRVAESMETVGKTSSEYAVFYAEDGAQVLLLTRPASEDGSYYPIEYDSAFIGRKEGETIRYIPLALSKKSKYGFFSRVKNLVAVADVDGAVTIYNSITGNKLTTLRGYVGAVNAMATVGDSIVLTGYGDGTLLQWDLSTARMNKVLKSEKWIENIEVNPTDGLAVAGTGDGSILTWNVFTNSGAVDLLYRDSASFVTALAFAPSAKVLAACFRKNDGSSEVGVFDYVTGNLLHTVAHGVFDKSSNPFVDDTRLVIYADGSFRLLDIVSKKTLATFENKKEDFRKFRVYRTHGRLLTAYSGYKDGNSDRQVGKFCAWDLSGRKVFEVKVDGETFEDFAVNPSGSTIATVLSSGPVWVLDAKTGKKLQEYNLPWGRGNRMKFVSEQELLFEASGEVQLITLSNKTVRKVASGVWLQHWENKPYYNKLERIITLSENSSFAVNHLQSGKTIASFCNIGDNDYIIYEPQGYYFSSKNAARLLHYATKNLKVVTFEQLDLQFNRPDKILRALGSKDSTLIDGYYKAYEKRLKRLGVSQEMNLLNADPPEVRLLNEKSIAYETNAKTLSLNISFTGKQRPLLHMNAWVNENPLFGQDGRILKGRNLSQLDTTLSIQLTPGINRIEVSAMDEAGLESFRSPVYVQYNPSSPEEEKIHFIGIGIDKFQNPAYNLNWSVKDIRDMARTLKQKYANNVSIDTLFDQRVTVRNIVALKSKLNSTAVNDRVIIAYSGHGILDQDLNYFLSTYAVNFDQPDKDGLPYSEIERLLDNVPARKKLLLIDACHSGEVDKEEAERITQVQEKLDSTKRGATTVTVKKKNGNMRNSFELMQELFVNVGRGTGATVISAAGGMQFALERGDLKNGVFTFTILDAFRRNPTLTINELKEIVVERVLDLTNGVQKPTFRNETNEFNWRVW